MSRKYFVHFVLVVHFFVVGCAFSVPSTEKTTATQRAIETKEYSVSKKELMKASVSTFQDLGYTISVINEEFGIITANKIEPGGQVVEDEPSFNPLVVLGAIFLVSALFADDDDHHEERGRWRGSSSNGDTVVIKDETLTATLNITEITEDPLLSSLRINFDSREKKASVQFFKEFFAAIEKSLFLEQNL